MRRLEITIQVIIAALLITSISRLFDLLSGYGSLYHLVDFLIPFFLLVFSIVWFIRVRQNKKGARLMTGLFMSLPLLFAVGQVCYIWLDDEDIVFKVWVSFCVVVVSGIYTKFILKWYNQLGTDLK